MNFDVQNRSSISKVSFSKPHVVISISNPGDAYADIVETNLIDVLYLFFDDIVTPMPGYVAFNESHAIEILKFWNRYQNEVDLFIAHCNAGMSRSPGVIAALNKIYNNDDLHWFKMKSPNMLVYKTILEVYHGNSNGQ
jgi:predicted protein tyrosine phosphatase